MKKIYHILLIMLAMSFGLIACTEETPFSTATENDDPRILDPLFPDRVNGELPVVSNISRDANFSMTLTVPIIQPLHGLLTEKKYRQEKKSTSL